MVAALVLRDALALILSLSKDASALQDEGEMGTDREGLYGVFANFSVS